MIGLSTEVLCLLIRTVKGDRVCMYPISINVEDIRKLELGAVIVLSPETAKTLAESILARLKEKSL